MYSLYFLSDFLGSGRQTESFWFVPAHSVTLRAVMETPGPSDSYMLIPGAYSDVE